ncbi:restriction endonuclease [Halobacterium jilantaiense]|uniref:Restriction endonuclease n=1 Tax=Halobacterium jilantaiense TaxID=355548 RepID=A0A1I0P3V6_9EURY|nr:restriction endonuclease [Halobacterium jilantaiense]SEW08721.1 Restriction endonuclease [Halobacterium jilantaiense]
MFEEMDESAFPEFLAAFWGEKGWDASVTPNDDGTYLVAGDRDNGKRGLIGVRPAEDTEVDASEVEDFAAFCERKGVDVRVMATRGRFTTGARSAADAADVHLLDPNELATSVRDEDAEHLLDDFETGGGGGGLLGRIPSLPVSVPAGIPVVPILVAALVVVAAVFVGPTLLGSVPFIGNGSGGGASGPAVTALSLSDANQTVADVTWDVRTQTDLGNYSAPSGKTFIVVQLNVSSTGNGDVDLRDEHFALAVNDTFRSVQSFENESRSFRSAQLPTLVSSGESARAVVVFVAPESFDGATLVETYEGPGLRFERADLAFDVA